uniref:Uncharacterized protein n=1 Tax=Tanacetum cinerariifolium TaxID=118510 RepID=A0A6L2JF52_TANCI|nr:hypothetical protein [Tanacetum cinerariifolium]
MDSDLLFSIKRGEGMRSCLHILFFPFTDSLMFLVYYPTRSSLKVAACVRSCFVSLIFRADLLNASVVQSSTADGLVVADGLLLAIESTLTARVDGLL